jgi:hypothetical protein
MTSVLAELFEAICEELNAHSTSTITEEVISEDVVEELANRYKTIEFQPTLDRSLQDLEAHFSAKGSSLPFQYDLRTMQFESRDRDYIEFVVTVNSIRGRPLPDSKTFEEEVCRRLATKLTGELHSIGYERRKKRSVREFGRYLEQLGFTQEALDPNANDAGLDILWFPPLGKTPIRPMISFQCKNSSYDKQDGFESVGQTETTFHRHRNMTAAQTYICCVVFNSYIDESFDHRTRGLTFVPLGLSDMASARKTVEAFYL